MSAIVIGESMIEVIKGDDETIHRPGGAMLATSIGLARLGRDVRFITDFGTDYSSDVIAAQLEQHSIQTVTRDASVRPSKTMVAHLAHVGTGIAPFSYEDVSFDIPNPPSTATELLDLDLFAPRAVLFGSNGCFIKPGASKVLDWVRLLRERATVFFDPNVRPALIDDLDHARERVEECISMSDIVKASEKDLMTLYGNRTEFDEVAKDWLARGAAIVVISHGLQGSILYSKPGSVIALPSLQENLVDPTGSQQAYTAAMIDCLARIALDTAARREELQSISDANLEMLGVFATAAASVTSGHRGPKMPTRDELMDQYHVYRTNPHALI